MATNYLKKRKMAFIIGDIFNITPKLKNCFYRSCRGTEWLNCSDDNFCYEMCVRNGGSYLRVTKFHYDNDDNLFTVYSQLLNGYKCYSYDVQERLKEYA